MPPRSPRWYHWIIAWVLLGPALPIIYTKRRSD